MDRPNFGAPRRTYQSLDFSDEEVDAIYDRFDASLKAQVDTAVALALDRQGFANVRPGSARWSTTRRVVLRSMLCEAEDRETDSETGV